MSWSMTCVLPWTELDFARVRDAIDAAIRDCATKWPAYSKSRVEVDEVDGDRGHLHVYFAAELVEQAGWEIEPPSFPMNGEPYPCTFDHYWIEPDPVHDYPGECGLSLRSNVSANRDAWMTASHVLERATTRLGGTLRDF